MKRIFLLLVLTFPLFAQTFADDFDSSASLANWKRFDQSEGWPDMAKRIAVDDGKLVIEPWTCGWYADFHAPFVYREVTGDFEMTARVRVRGKSSELPAEPWSLAGLMVRAPRRETMKTWTPNGENWLFVTTGIAFKTGEPVFETKSTVNSESKLRLAPARAGWMELRITRKGATFTLASKFDNEEWQTRETFTRNDLPQTVQAGVNAYSGWNSMLDLQNDPKAFNAMVLKDRRADAILEVDSIRITRQ